MRNASGPSGLTEPGPRPFNACNQARGYAPAAGSLSGTPDAYEDYKRHDGQEDEDLLGFALAKGVASTLAKAENIAAEANRTLAAVGLFMLGMMPPTWQSKVGLCQSSETGLFATLRGLEAPFVVFGIRIPLFTASAIPFQPTHRLFHVGFAMALRPFPARGSPSCI